MGGTPRYLRKNVWELGGNWAEQILWYARGVAALKSRPFADQSSWRSFGAMHGIDFGLWHELGYFHNTETLPPQSLRRQLWKQCQHGTWYFLPWHRGYLLAFEAQIRQAVTDLGGPADWALPYWNYLKAGQRRLPPAFASANWPDGDGNNPLYVRARYGPADDRNVYVPPGTVNLAALRNPRYTGAANGGNPGFGGVDTGFAHSGVVHGGLESQPHDWVHGLVGGANPANPRLPGLMSDPDTAALDPIFWLHHANIDRLWEVWRRNSPNHLDPVARRWVNGPTAVGERGFLMPMPGGSLWSYTPGDMTDLSALGYSYDDLPVVAGTPSPSTQQSLAPGPDTATSDIEGAAMAQPNAVQLVGASQPSLRLDGGELRTEIRLDAATRDSVAASFTAAADRSPTPDSVYLNLENVRGMVDSTALNSYLSVPAASGVEERLAGSIALFGVRKASTADGEHAGQGLTFVLDITDIIEELHLKNALDLDALSVRVAPTKPLAASAEVSIGRISIYREGR